MGWAELESALAEGAVRENDHCGDGGFRVVTEKSRLGQSQVFGDQMADL